MNKPVLWLLAAPLDHPDICYAAPAVAWAAERSGVLFECYLESERTGDLFARTGSTVIGGHHHQQLNYLHARCEVKVLLLRETGVFTSSFEAFGDDVLVRAETLAELYAWIMAQGMKPSTCICLPGRFPAADGGSVDIAPYIYPEIFFREAFACTEEEWDTVRSLTGPEIPACRLWTNVPADAECIAEKPEKYEYGEITLWMAERWKSRAKALAFGDPDAVRSRIAAMCGEKRVAVYAPAVKKQGREVKLSAYMEETSAIAEQTAKLAQEIGDPVLVGRQTCDGDLFCWGKHGVSLQIMDPNRPAFPVVEKLSHPWRIAPGTVWDREPDDAQLERWADEGKVLSALVFHSGEMAHNEAMLQLVDLCSFTDLKLGIAVHAARYETCPQMWELIGVPVEQGGVRGKIEPVLHSGGLGVMGECGCPPEAFGRNCKNALSRIEAITGKENLPRGHYFFMDSDPETLQDVPTELYDAMDHAGLQYGISSAKPGRNRLLYEKVPVLNQSTRVQCSASPFLRVSTAENIHEASYFHRPGWVLGVMDAPVISFMPHIWRKGSRFMELVDVLCHGNMINVLPDTVARYAKILARKGLIPVEGKHDGN